MQASYLVAQVFHINAVDDLGAVLLDARVEWPGFESRQLLQLFLNKKCSS